MSGSTIGALRVVLGADTASFEDGMKRASKDLEAWGKSAKVLSATISAALSGAIIGLGVAIGSAVEQADKLGKLSQSMGIPVEQLSQLKLAADLAGVPVEALAKSFATLSKNMADAATNSKTEAARAFQAMGISVRDANGNLKTAQAVLVEMAGKFQGYADGAAKSALATATLGKNGAALIPMLNEGADGLQHMMQQAKELGLTIDDKTAKAASQFNDNLTIMRKTLDAIGVQVASELLPSMLKLSSGLGDAAKNGELARSVADTIVSSFTKVTEVIMTVITGVDRLGIEWKAFKDLLETDVFSGKLADNWNKFLDAGRDTRLVMAQLHASFENDPLGTFANNFANAAGKVAKSAAPIITGAKSGQESVDSFIASITKQSAKLQAHAEALTMTTAEAAAYEKEQEAITLATEKQIPLTDALLDKIFNASTAYGQIAEQVEKAKLKFNELKQIGESVGTALSSTLQDWIKNGGKFLDVLKNLASKLLDIAFQATVTKPLQAIFGSMFSGAPLKLPAFAQGGSFTVPGAGGIDSQVAAMRVTPGEQVTVTKPGQGDGGGNQMIFAPQYSFSPGMTGNDIAAVKTMIKQSSSETLALLQRMNRANSSWQFA